MNIEKRKKQYHRYNLVNTKSEFSAYIFNIICLISLWLLVFSVLFGSYSIWFARVSILSLLFIILSTLVSEFSHWRMKKNPYHETYLNDLFDELIEKLSEQEDED